MSTSTKSAKQIRAEIDQVLRSQQGGPDRGLPSLRMTRAQQDAVDAIRSAGGAVVRVGSAWEGDVRISWTTIKSLEKAGVIACTILPPRGRWRRTECRLTAIGGQPP